MKKLRHRKKKSYPNPTPEEAWDIGRKLLALPPCPPPWIPTRRKLKRRKLKRRKKCLGK